MVLCFCAALRCLCCMVLVKRAVGQKSAKLILILHLIGWEYDVFPLIGQSILCKFLEHGRTTTRKTNVSQTYGKSEANARKPQGKRNANARQTKGKFKADAVFSSRVILMNIYSFRWRSSLRLSLKDILNAVDTGSEFAWRKKLWFEIGKTEVEGTLKNCNSNCLVPFFKSCGKEGFESQILEVLDQGTCNCRL